MWHVIRYETRDKTQVAAVANSAVMATVIYYKRVLGGGGVETRLGFNVSSWSALIILRQAKKSVTGFRKRIFYVAKQTSYEIGL